MREIGISDEDIKLEIEKNNDTDIEVLTANMDATKAFLMCDIKFQSGMSIVYTGVSKSECVIILKEMGFSGEELIATLLKVVIMSNVACEYLNGRVKKK